jgi:hypothetical protein
MTEKSGSKSVGVDQENGSLMLALSTASSRAPATKPRPWFDALSAVARRKLNAPPEWEWYSARVLTPTDDTLVEGNVPLRRKDGSARKGHARWEGVVGQQCVVTRAEIDAATAEYEATTGNCSSCAGSGETISSVSVQDGTRYRPCRKCNGSGHPSAALSSSPTNLKEHVENE